jgi:microcin C transport system ATP-binding protein
MTVGEIIGEGLRIHMPGMPQADRDTAIARALEEVGLEQAAHDRLPHEFSGGQRQRIAVARAMILNPDFVVLDEPTSALDLSVQAQMVALLRELQTRHRSAFLFISHDMKVVRALSHYLIVMRAGKVIEQGPSAEIFAAPKEAYTKVLMAAALELEVAGAC